MGSVHQADWFLVVDIGFCKAYCLLQNLIPLSTALTSIYDHSIFEAMSKVVQKLIYPLEHIENMLNILVSATRMEKVFIFDVVSKIYVATDSSPVDITM